jgi:hypothetical protein
LAAANRAWLLEQFCELEHAVFMAHAANSSARTTSCCGPGRAPRPRTRLRSRRCPCEPALRRLIHRPAMTLPRSSRDPTLALDQHVAGRRGGRCDQRNATRALFDLAAHPLDAGAGLARAAAGSRRFARRPAVRLGRFEARSVGALIEMRDLISSSTLAAIPMSTTRTVPQNTADLTRL